MRFFACVALSTLLILFIKSLPVSTRSCTNDGRTVQTPVSHPAPSCRYEYLVSIRDPTFGTHRCGGTLINSNYVLTAASCVVGYSSFDVYINCYYRDGDCAERLTMDSINPHPDYTDAESPYDVALGRLSASSSQATVRFATRTPNRGTTVAVVGWGRTGPQQGFSEEMQARTDYRISPSACNSMTVESGFICAGRNNVNICEGDLGGPLLRLGNDESEDTQVGVISRAVGDCSRRGAPGLFTDVADIRRWIEDNS